MRFASVRLVLKTKISTFALLLAAAGAALTRLIKNVFMADQLGDYIKLV
jgi:hypothetical protein